MIYSVIFQNDLSIKLANKHLLLITYIDEAFSQMIYALPLSVHSHRKKRSKSFAKKPHRTSINLEELVVIRLICSAQVSKLDM